MSLSAEIFVVIRPPALASLGRKEIYRINVGRIRPAPHKAECRQVESALAGLRLALPSNITDEATGKIIVVEGKK
jgi:hypothetical protein